MRFRAKATALSWMLSTLRMHFDQRLIAWEWSDMDQTDAYRTCPSDTRDRKSS